MPSRTLVHLIGRAITLGAALGALCLGAGGRLAMWLFARITGRPPAVTLRGSLTVVLAGAIAGALGGLLFAALTRRWTRAGLTRGIAFGAAFLVLLSPGIRPPWPLTLALFTPMLLLFGGLLERAWDRPA